MLKENWIEVNGYEGMYEVSDKGRVRSIDRTIVRSDNAVVKLRGKILRSGMDRGRYEIVVLSRGGKTLTQKVHRLVAQAFIYNPNNKPHVNHINGVKTHNNSDNLEWATPKENQNHAARKGLLKNTGPKSRHVRRGDGIIFFSIKYAAKYCKLDYTNISRCAHGKLKTSGGYTWSFVS